ncbi:DUF411 domain-containing protein [Methyloceanibacter sp.]|uniref:DUF411 domain-containing protein n=1 Tax=Methyloceanibacter sp. TaxID=1965321 RepID=UPI002D1F9A79|nr:DUF411 domain-containing protein [Methyloceanibacter sp.]
MMKNPTKALAIVALLALPLSSPAEAANATLYKNPHCTCCEEYAEYLRQNGFEVDVKDTPDLEATTLDAGIPEKLFGCHITFIDGYAVVGHVSAEIVQKLLKEHQPLIGVAIPGMPAGVPGMNGAKEGPINVYAVSKDSEPTVYAVQ